MDLQKRFTPNASVIEITPGHWQLSTPPGPSDVYRWAQLDDYLHRPRKDFCWLPPLSLVLEAAFSDPSHNGTWGFGFWNDPFNASLGLGGSARRLPVLPNAAWFFYASPPNHLALHTHPADGFLAATFRSPRIPSLALAPGLILAPLLFTHPSARLLRKLAGIVVKDQGERVNPDVRKWHTYGLDWFPDRVDFYIDGTLTSSLNQSPRGPLGFVLWVDNQFAAFPPDGKLGFGTLPNPQPAVLAVKNLSITPLKSNSR